MASTSTSWFPSSWLDQVRAARVSARTASEPHVALRVSKARSVDRELVTIAALEPGDGRTVELWVAGPGALLVAKVHKIAERVDAHDRVRDKDALDVLRLLRAIDTAGLAHRLLLLSGTELSASVTSEAITLLPALFGSTDGEGVAMAVRAVGAAEDSATIAASLVALVDELLSRCV